MKIPNKEKQFKILEKLILHENTVAELYAVCGRMYPENSDFWEAISGEEKIHARWLVDLKPKIENEQVYLETERFTEQSTASSISYLNEKRQEIEEGKKTEMEALFVALENENALIESGNLTLFSTDSAGLKHFLNFLLEETERHRNIIKDRVEEEKSRP